MRQAKRPAALVTGGARRIGRDVALALAADGYDIALHYNTSAADAAKTAAVVRKLGVDCDIFPADLLDAGEAAALLRGAARRFPLLNVLVNSASLFLPSDMGVQGLVLLEQHLAIHVKAPWALSAEFVKVVGSGVILNFLDTKVTKNQTDFGAYLLSKKALAELTKMQAVAFAPAVRVNAIAPGLILAPEGKNAGYLRQRAAAIPLKRPGDVKDVIAAVRFLVTSGYVTGQTIFVDGGESLI
jgi:NAD(P)-dependent dehydrogenase (short-subunit alcohol dehydrogenase family)